MRIDWLYALTTDGKEFNQLCDYVHGFADKIIEARRSKLVSGNIEKIPRYSLNRIAHVAWCVIPFSATDVT